MMHTEYVISTGVFWYSRPCWKILDTLLTACKVPVNPAKETMNRVMSFLPFDQFCRSQRSLGRMLNIAHGRTKGSLGSSLGRGTSVIPCFSVFTGTPLDSTFSANSTSLTISGFSLILVAVVFPSVNPFYSKSGRATQMLRAVGKLYSSPLPAFAFTESRGGRCITAFRLRRLHFVGPGLNCPTNVHYSVVPRGVNHVACNSPLLDWRKQDDQHHILFWRQERPNTLGRRIRDI